MRRPLNVRRYARSFRHALDGVLDAYRSQRHMRVHFVFMALNAILAMVYRLNAVEVAVVTICVSFVVFAEMINTVIEATLNMVTETYHPIARFAKDVAAGAVLISALNAVVVSVCIYFNPERINRLRDVWVTGDYVDDSAMLRALAVSMMLLLIIITALKVGRPEASVLQGGPVSGHTAFAFCFATSLYFVVRNTTVVYLAVFLAVASAVLVAQLRLHDPTHRVRTVIYGAALGVAVPLVVFGLLTRPTG
ncbi:MAG: diacylglycerol kinase [Armatimonadetes bacterium]|nr:diacylglycerol kinase [Armatimonadota bacterium]